MPRALAKRPKARVAPKPKRTNPHDKKWHPMLVDRARDLAWCGLNHSQIAYKLGVTDRTFYRWLKEHPELRLAVSEYEDATGSVVRSLYARAKGYEHPETKAQWASDYQIQQVYDEETGDIVDKAVKVGRWETIDMVKHYPPDTAAALAILQNRLPDQWRAKAETQELNVNLTVRRALMELANE